MITILDIVEERVGKKASYDGLDFEQAGVALMGGCQGCNASIAAYNAYPSKTGYWQCKDCITPEIAFESVKDFDEWSKEQEAAEEEELEED